MEALVEFSKVDIVVLRVELSIDVVFKGCVVAFGIIVVERKTTPSIVSSYKIPCEKKEIYKQLIHSRIRVAYKIYKIYKIHKTYTSLTR